jgi:wobble nucleotide-excising tRNase
VELCKGKESETEEIQNKIVVIDDPISSLSHNYIFNVAQLIKNVIMR